MHQAKLGQGGASVWHVTASGAPNQEKAALTSFCKRAEIEDAGPFLGGSNLMKSYEMLRNLNLAILSKDSSFFSAVAVREALPAPGPGDPDAIKNVFRQERCCHWHADAGEG